MARNAPARRPGGAVLGALVAVAPWAGAWGAGAAAPGAPAPRDDAFRGPAWRLERTERLGASTLERFARSRDGVPVVGAGVAIADGAGRPRWFHAPPLPPASGEHRVEARHAAGAALDHLRASAAGGVVRRVAKAWAPLASRLRPVWRVDVVTPRADWRVVVDAGSGTPLFSWDRRASAVGAVYAVSPAETPDGACPPDGAITSVCAPTVDRALPDRLTAAFGEVVGCAGADPFSAPASCVATALPDTSGRYAFAPDPVSGGRDDAFAEVSAFHHVEESVAYLARLAPSAPAPAPLTVYVNAASGGAVLENAFYSPGAGTLVFGQGQSVDYAYDGSLATHELVHAWTDALGGLEPFVDELGFCIDALSIGEGSADALAAARTGRPEIGLYAGRGRGQPYLRRIGGVPTCAGDGTRTTFRGVATVTGLVGEPHADGAIWSALSWELQEGLRAVRGCGGSCSAAAELEAAALRATSGTSPVSFRAHGDALVAAAEALHPGDPAIAEYVRCLARRHALAGCDARAVEIFAGEPKAVLASTLPTLQVSVRATAPSATLRVCTANGATAQLHLRRDAPVGTVMDDVGRTSFVSDRTVAVAAACDAGGAELALDGPATWWAAGVSGEPARAALVQLTATSGAAARAPPPEATVCAYTPPPAPPAAQGCGCGTGAGAPLAGVPLLALALRLALRRVSRTSPPG
ncbi:MAG TPA: hypothetical protein VFL83_20085 [Anaeromyxobacter sp.]|nr:hypothetical protein [Anaeromyxobacter sp.]